MLGAACRAAAEALPDQVAIPPGPAARQLHLRSGFRACPERPMTLVVALQDAQAMIETPSAS